MFLSRSSGHVVLQKSLPANIKFPLGNEGELVNLLFFFFSFKFVHQLNRTLARAFWRVSWTWEEKSSCQIVFAKVGVGSLVRPKHVSNVCVRFCVSIGGWSVAINPDPLHDCAERHSVRAVGQVSWPLCIFDSIFNLFWWWCQYGMNNLKIFSYLRTIRIRWNILR